MTDIDKAEPRTLYVRRDVVNKADLVKWAKAQGFTDIVPDMHVTIAYSRTPVDWFKVGTSWAPKLEISAGGPRQMAELGPDGEYKALLITVSDLVWRNSEIREAGASWDWPDYQPHISIQVGGDVDLDKVEAYQGKIVLGPEIFEEVRDMEKQNVRIAKVDEALGIVFGWAIVCKIDGEDYYDLNIDKNGERVPEHIPEDAMLKGTIDFMSGARAGNEMHAGPDVGTFVCAWPMTTEIAKAMGITTEKTGLMVAYKPPADVLAKFVSGEYTGFSIEGVRLAAQEIA